MVGVAVTQIVTFDKADLDELVERLDASALRTVDAGLRRAAWTVSLPGPTRESG